MNQWEIEDACNHCRGHVTLGPASEYLLAFCELINNISDGWAYWSYGTKCSEDLQKIVNEGKWSASQMPGPKLKDVQDACRKIQTFLKRCDQTKNKTEVLEFLKKTI